MILFLCFLFREFPKVLNNYRFDFIHFDAFVNAHRYSLIF